ncbi:hypothetical protein [Streptomyces thermoalcalitolerans]
MCTWYEDYTWLLLRIAGRLTMTDQEVVAEAAVVLKTCHLIAAPAQEAFSIYINAQRAAHGSNVWAAFDPQLRKGHREAV